MRRPNVDRWCERFVAALVKNLPKVETYVSGDDVYRIATGYVARAIVTVYQNKSKCEKGGDPNEEVREEAGGEGRHEGDGEEAGEEGGEEVRQVQEVSVQ